MRVSRRFRGLGAGSALLIALAVIGPGCKNSSDTVVGPPAAYTGPTYTVSGTVRAAGRHLAGAKVTLFDSAGTIRRATANAEGYFTITGVEPGTWTARSSSYLDWGPATAQVVVPPDATNVDLHMLIPD